MSKIIKIGGVVLASGLSLGVAAQHKQVKEENTKRPNLLLFIADDWSYPHAGVYGDKTVRTPAFDFVANNGMLFSTALCAAPTSTASRAAVLTGKYSHALGGTGNLWSLFPKDMSTYTKTLDQNGYSVGYTKKGWGPGKFEDGAWADNPAGHYSDNLKKFIQDAQSENKPFCFWYGSKYPHRPYEKGKGRDNGIDPDKLIMPEYLPDTPQARIDMADYYYYVERLDYELEETIRILRETGEFDNTLIIVTGDNGMPFPRAKASLYDAGTLEPFAVMWGNKIGPGVVCNQAVSLTDICPTFLTAAQLSVPKDVQGTNLLPLLLENKPLKREFVNSGRERHGYNARPNHVGYPSRSLRSDDFLLVHNYHPERYPGGDPKNDFNELGGHSDVDSSPTKAEIIARKDESFFTPYYDRAFAFRPEWELYDVKKDPSQFFNLANDPQYSKKLNELKAKMKKWQEQTVDPRAKGPTDLWDHTPYFGKANADAAGSGQKGKGKGKGKRHQVEQTEK